VIDGESKFPVIDYAKLTFMHLSEFLAHVKFFRIAQCIHYKNLPAAYTLRYDTTESLTWAQSLKS